MHRRLNITLPEDTVRLIDTVTQKGDRSSFINEAVQYYIKQKTSALLVNNYNQLIACCQIQTLEYSKA